MHIFRDIKPENVMLDHVDRIVVVDWNTVPVDKLIVKIGDFGFSRDVASEDQKQSLSSQLGTPFYWAPEVMEPGGKKYHLKVDIYSAGVVGCELGLGRKLDKNDKGLLTLALSFKNVFFFNNAS